MRKESPKFGWTLEIFSKKSGAGIPEKLPERISKEITSRIPVKISHSTLAWISRRLSELILNSCRHPRGNFWRTIWRHTWRNSTLDRIYKKVYWCFFRRNFWKYSRSILPIYSWRNMRKTLWQVSVRIRRKKCELFLTFFRNSWEFFLNIFF